MKMIKAFALNERGKIELTLGELQKLLEEAEAEGRRLAGQPSIVYRECPIQTIPVVKRTEIGDPLPRWQQGTCQATATGTVSKTEETAREKFDREFNEGVMRGTLLYSEAKGK